MKKTRFIIVLIRKDGSPCTRYMNLTSGQAFDIAFSLVDTNIFRSVFVLDTADKNEMLALWKYFKGRLKLVSKVNKRNERGRESA